MYGFIRRDSLSQLRVERRWFELASKGDLVITNAEHAKYDVVYEHQTLWIEKM